jgi:DNA-binding NtrC family response regulator
MKTADDARTSILVVDDEAVVRESLGDWFREDGYDVEVAESGSQALQKAAEKQYDIALLDIKMPSMDGLELQARLREACPELATVMMTAYASVETAVRALKEGADDYIVKPFDPDDLLRLVRRLQEHRNLKSENLRLKRSLEAASPSQQIVGTSPATQRVLELIETVAASDATVLVQGESGTGKELVAHALHASSARRYNPLVTVHCGALAEGLLESELFGHEKGAFTGASYQHRGKFEQAEGGTVLLDEIGDISPRVQVDLLRVLEEKRVTRVGGKESIPVDFRIVAATHRDLEAMASGGRFRQDLYYRLNVVTITVPPLRERPEDIRPLAEHFREQISRSMNKRGVSFSPQALQALDAYAWPGNVRELRNAVERAMVLGSTPVIQLEDLPIRVTVEPRVPSAPRSLAAVERDHVVATLEATDWNISRSATILGVDRSTLYAKIKRYGLERQPHGT